MIVEYLDLKTGKKAKDSGISEFELTENNWSCDCNRMTAFGLSNDSGVCDGCKRFIVISVVKEITDELFDEEYTLKHANAEYYLKTSKP